MNLMGDKMKRIKHKRDIHPGALLPPEARESIRRGGSVGSKRIYSRKSRRARKTLENALKEDNPTYEQLLYEDLEWYFLHSETTFLW